MLFLSRISIHVLTSCQDDAKYSKSVARSEDPDYKAPNTADDISDPERMIIGSDPADDESEKAKSRDVTINEMPVLR